MKESTKLNSLSCLKKLTFQQALLLVEHLKKQENHYLSYLCVSNPERFYSELNPEERKTILSIASRISTGTPLEYIIEETCFYGEKFVIKRGVLLPRPETEFLVDTVIEFARKENNEALMEVGTGSGAPMVMVVKNLLREHSQNRRKFYGVEIAPIAFQNTQENLKLHGLQEKITLLFGDFFKLSRDLLPRIIFSNPPYIGISENVESTLEEKTALFSGPTGTEFYLKLFRKIKRGTLLVVEVSERVSEKLRLMSSNLRKVKLVKIVKDFDGRERVHAYWLPE